MLALRINPDRHIIFSTLVLSRPEIGLHIKGDFQNAE
jgi:hypothetical protein